MGSLPDTVIIITTIVIDLRVMICKVGPIA